MQEFHSKKYHSIFICNCLYVEVVKTASAFTQPHIIQREKKCEHLSFIKSFKNPSCLIQGEERI